MNTPVLFIVIPLYNEEEVLPKTAPLFLSKLNTLIEKREISDKSKILFVNDGSRDNTWDIVSELAKKDRKFVGISLSRNRGHQNALLAGLTEAGKYADVTISIDCDGQDDIDAMDEMLRKYKNGAEIVYGVRDSRKTDSFFKRTTAEGFYKFMKLLGVETVYNHADYRLLSKRVLTELENFREVNLFLRGMIPLVGFKSDTVYYKRTERLAGKTHYSFSKMLSLALNGITNLSTKPIRIITCLGFIIALLSFIGIIYAVVAVATGNSAAGWASTVCIICFVSGIQLISIGVIGEYVGKIYLEVKNRPRFIIAERTWHEEKDK